MIETQSGGGMRKQPIAVERKKNPITSIPRYSTTSCQCRQRETAMSGRAPALSGSLLILLLPFLITVDASSAGSEAA